MPPPASRLIRLDLQYDGTDFVGWQIQKQGRSVQGELARALRAFLQEDIVPVAAGRTDAGTHAGGQVAHFRTASTHSTDVVVRALNSLLPDDVAVSSARDAAPDFHARYSAVSKRYRYRISTTKSPLERRFVWSLHRPLDLDAMVRASSLLEGVHEFQAFCNCDPVPASFTCNVLDTGWKSGDSEFVFEIAANRFLRHMVRIIVGTLTEIAQGRRDSEDITRLLSPTTGADRREAGPTAPAHGLCLIRVNYPSD